jgi:CRP/FNR family cyclic AMP-dependent transcriptional regulator
MTHMGATMRTPYNLNAQQHCTTCTLRQQAGRFCNMSNETLASMDSLKFTGFYPKGSLLFVEGEQPRGVFVLCSGRAKLTTSSSEGKTLIVKMAGAGEILGVSATILGNAYEVSAETLEPAQVNFIGRDNFLRLLSSHADASMNTAKQLSHKYQAAQREIRTLGLSQTTSEKLAKLILTWCEDGEETPTGVRLKMLLTHEEIGQMIGTTRETVTRLLSDFRRKKIIDVKGSTFFVAKATALHAMVSI